MTGLKGANLAVKFALEVVAIAAFAIWGANASGVVAAVILGIGTPAAAAALWGVLAAPQSKRRLPTRARVPFELGVLGLAAAALVDLGSTTIAAVFAAVVVVNAVLLFRLGQLEE